MLEAEHCGDFTKTARRALRELAKPVEAHAEVFTPAEVSVVYSSLGPSGNRPSSRASSARFPPTHTYKS